ncbi:MAG: hypothetical protein Kow0037_20520 [Calditrichia bacterium]
MPGPVSDWKSPTGRIKYFPAEYEKGTLFCGVPFLFEVYWLGFGKKHHRHHLKMAAMERSKLLSASIAPSFSWG